MKREVGYPYSLDPELSAGHIMSLLVVRAMSYFFFLKCSSLLPAIAMSKS